MKNTLISLARIVPVVLAAVLLFSGVGGRWFPAQTPIDTDLTPKQPTEVVYDTARRDKKPQNTTATRATTLPQPVYTAAPVQQTTVTPTPVADVVQEYAENGYVVSDNGVTRHPIREYTALLTPNDPNSGQWWESSMNLSAAWDLGTGSTSTTLAIIDTGVALEHEEFSGRWHENSGESGTTASENASQLNCTDQSVSLNQSCNRIDDNFDGVVDNESGTTSMENPSTLNCTDQSIALDKSCNMVDDDGNGLVDDYRGWDFINYDRSVQAGEINPNGVAVEHGTAVTGAAAATGNNGVGIAGVNWGTKILPIQALADDGYGTSISIARAVRYAIEQNADVISMSLGGTFPDSFLRGAITDALSAGIIVVAASGNSGCNCVSYPANYPEVVAVGALAPDNEPASFSSYGANLDILAPGVGIYSTGWSASNPTSDYASFISGTSIATPMVSGAFATLLAHQPALSQTELLATLSESANRLSLASTEYRTDKIGFGTTDLRAAALRATTPLSSTQITALTPASHGSSLSSTPLQGDADITVYHCDNNELGTTPLYRMSLGDSVFYTASLNEFSQAQLAGYSSQLFTYLCTLLPDDHGSVDAIKTHDIYLEFENEQRKS